MKRAMKMEPTDCRAFRHKLADRAASGQLEVDSDMAAHARQCPECRARLAATSTVERAQRLPVQTPVELEARVLARIESRRDELQRHRLPHRPLPGRHAAVRRGHALLRGPALAAAAVVLIVLTAAVTTLVNRTTMDAVATTVDSSPDAASEIVEVHLVLEAPNARSVAVAGDWNDWDTSVHRLTDQDGDGIWELRFRVKAGREYEYQFVVDETTWISDPQALIRVDDGFGGTNSILEI